MLRYTVIVAREIRSGVNGELFDVISYEGAAATREVFDSKKKKEGVVN